MFIERTLILEKSLRALTTDMYEYQNVFSNVNIFLKIGPCF